MMKFKVSSKDLFGKTAIIAEANETFYKRSRNRGGMACDYWDCIPRDAQQDESSLRPNKRVLSHAQVSIQFDPFNLCKMINSLIFQFKY